MCIKANIAMSIMKHQMDVSDVVFVFYIYIYLGHALQLIIDSYVKDRNSSIKQQ